MRSLGPLFSTDATKFILVLEINRRHNLYIGTNDLNSHGNVLHGSDGSVLPLASVRGGYEARQQFPQRKIHQASSVCFKGSVCNWVPVCIKALLILKRGFWDGYLDKGFWNGILGALKGVVSAMVFDRAFQKVKIGVRQCYRNVEYIRQLQQLVFSSPNFALSIWRMRHGIAHVSMGALNICTTVFKCMESSKAASWSLIPLAINSIFDMYATLIFAHKQARREIFFRNEDCSMPFCVAALNASSSLAMICSSLTADTKPPFAQNLRRACLDKNKRDEKSELAQGWFLFQYALFLLYPEMTVAMTLPNVRRISYQCVQVIRETGICVMAFVLQWIALTTTNASYDGTIFC